MVFRVMLADNKPYNEGAVIKHLEEQDYLIMQPKIDGMRAAIDEEAKARTRSGKLHRNRFLQKWAMQHPSLRGLDGEVVSGHQMHANVFRDCMSGIRSEEGSPEFTFYAFDYFLYNIAQAEYAIRRECLAAIIENIGGEQIGDEYHAKLILCPQRIVRSLEEIADYEQELLTAGWEGAMLRHPFKPYKFNRSTWLGGELMKLKRFEDDEAEITGTFARERNDNAPIVDVRGYTTRSAHQDNKVALEMLGGVNCRLLRDPSITFDIGVFRGWNHSDLIALWKIREELPGRILKFKHQGYGGGYDKPRTPVGLGWRDPFDL